MIRFRHLVATAPLVAAFAVVSASADPACVDHGFSLELETVRVLPGVAPDMTVDGDMLAVAVDDLGVRVYDLADPTVPWFMGAVEVEGTGWRVAADAGLLALARGDLPTLHVVDVADLGAITLRGSVALPGRPVDMVVAGGYAYVLCDQSLRIEANLLVTVDLSDPDAPAVVDQENVADQADRLDVDGGLLAVVNPLMPNLELFDLAAPAVPASVGEWHAGGLMRDVDIVGGVAHLAGSGVLAAVDVSDPSDPTTLWLRSTDGEWTDIGVDGTRTLLSGAAETGDVRLAILGAAETSDAPLATSVLGGGPFAMVPGRVLSLVDENFVAVIGAADLRRREPLGVIETDSLAGVVIDTAAHGSLTVALLDTENAMGGPTGRVWVIDMTDPENPVRRGFVDVDREPRALAIYGGTVAVASYVSGVNIGRLNFIDLSDPDAPTVASTVDLGGDPSDVQFRGRYVDVLVLGTGAVGHSDFWKVISVADPAAPVLYPNIGLPEGPYAFGGDEDRMVIAGDGWFDLYELPTPAEPVWVDTWLTSYVIRSMDLAGLDGVAGVDGFVLPFTLDGLGGIQFHQGVYVPGDCLGIELADGVAYVAAGDLVALDVSVPEDARWLGTLAGGAGRGVAVHQGAVFGAASGAGLHIVREHCDGGTSVAVAGWTAAASPHLATFSWRIHGEIDLDDLRLTAHRDDVRTVPIERDGDLFVARDPRARDSVLYRLQQRQGEGWTTLEEIRLRIPDAETPTATALGSPHPNPFNPRVTIPFAMAATGRATITVHDAAGRRVRTLADEQWPYGRHELIWDGTTDDGRDAAAGVYVVRLLAGEARSTRKISLIR